MSLPCPDLVSFADGELEPERAEAFRSHLLTCAACQAGLVEAMQMGSRLAALPPISERVKLAPDCRVAVPAISTGVDKPTPLKPKLPCKRRLTPWIGSVLAAAAVAVFYYHHRGSTTSATNAFAAQDARPYEIRIAYADAASYRPTRDTTRGAAGTSRERFSYAVLDSFQKRKDGHGLAIARAWNGDDLTKVAEDLREIEQTPPVRSDLAAFEVLTTSSDSVESVLIELEALQTSTDPTTAHAARWNYAILLSRMALLRSAARAFQAIAGEHEAGWGDEARACAEIAEKIGTDGQARWARANQAGAALVATGAPVPIDLVRAFPGIMRAHFYNAVRTAPTRERVLALEPMAVELDRRGAPILESYVRRVASVDFHRRAPLAGAYAQLLQHAPLAASVKAELTTPTASTEVADIVMGGMVELRATADHPAAFRRMANQINDPWFAIVLAKAEAAADTQRSNWLGAEARLREAEKLCGNPAVTYQCLDLARQLGKLYENLHRVPDALAVLRTAVRTARSSGEWGRYTLLLWQLADIERFNSSTATARAYANEILAIAGARCDHDFQSSAYLTLAGAALIDVDGRAARRDLEAALRCTAPDLPAANFLSDIGRLDPLPGDLPQLQDWLGKLRTSGTLTAAERVLADEIEGRLLVERDRTAGIKLLEGAIAAARALPRDIVAEKARAGAYSVLILDAAHQGDHARALGLIAQQLGLPPPGACTVGMVAEDERAAVVVRGADGRDHARYERTGSHRGGPLVVSDDLANPLDGCAHVQVMALAALQGQPRVLPARLPWSYTTGEHGPPAAHGKEPSEPRTLIVTNVTPPSYLQLPPLSGSPQASSPSTAALSGPDATPTRVLAAMAGASEIQFHTHALMDVGLSDASHLVLSPEPDGRYALTAEAIRGTELRDHPIIVLAACHSAQGARYQHAPWSLPDAFLAVGARAVFASAAAIPDLDAGAFFASVLARVHGGTDPATALRDERTARLAANPSSWVADVVLFE